MPHGDIAEYYDSIFSKDPLLLQKKSQETYSQALLKHLLLNRTTSAFAPMIVDLHDKADRERFQTRKALVGIRPPDDVIKRYRGKRIARKELPRRDREQLESITMVSRGKYTEKRIKTYKTHDAAIQSLRTAKSKINERLRIAAVGYRVQVSKLEKHAHLDEELRMLPKFRRTLVSRIGEGKCELDIGRTVFSSAKALKEWKSAIISHVETALDRGCHFIILPELALPSSSKKGEKIEQRLYERCQEPGTADHFMFAGSRHEGGSNRGLVLTRNGPKTCLPWWHHKVAPARGLGENIFGPYGTKRASYSALFQIREGERPNFPIDIAICYDSFDPTMFLNLILQSLVSTDNETRPRVMLVPSFNTSMDFVALLRDLSFLSRSLVVYVNGLHGDAKMYIAGFAVADFTDRNRTNKIRKQLRDEVEALKDVKDKILESLKLNPDEATALHRLNTKVSALKNLEQALKDLQDARALDCIITVQDRPGATAISGRYDPSDILYYNVDMGLINALFEFRAEYFATDLFLPEPFQYDNLKAAALELRKRIAKVQQADDLK
jgi:hypothetical protein